MEHLNIRVFSMINSLAGDYSTLDTFAKLIAEFAPLLCILYLAILWFRRERTRRKIVLLAICSALVGLAINVIIAVLYPHPRPFVIHLGKMLISHRPSPSFPSDHTTFMLSVSLLLALFKETRLAGLLLTILGFLCGLARIFCGVHFPLDIIGALGVAALSAIIIFLNRSRLIRGYRRCSTAACRQ